MQEQVEANGGIVFGTYTYQTEGDLRKLFMQFDPKGKSFAGVVCYRSLFVHDPDYRLGKSEGAILGSTVKVKLKDLGVAGLSREEDKKYALSFFLKYPFNLYRGETPAAGTPCAALASIESWKDTDGVEGFESAMVKSYTAAKEKHEQFVQDNLPPGELADLALASATAVGVFNTKLLAHINKEVEELMQFGIDEKAVAGLVTQQLTLIFEKMDGVRRKAYQYTADMNPVDYAVRAAWTTLKNLMVMQEYLADGLRNHPTLSTAYIRFLVRQTGSNSAATVGSKITSLTKDINGLKKTANLEVNKAKEALSKAEAVEALVKKLGRENKWRGL